MATLRELEAQETSLAYPALLELRPHLGSLDACVQQVNQEQRAEGYRLVGAFEDGIKDAVAVAGFRTLHTLALGLQHMVIEYARNVLGLAEADHAESNPDASMLLIAPLLCSFNEDIHTLLRSARIIARSVFTLGKPILNLIAWKPCSTISSASWAKRLASPIPRLAYAGTG